MGWGDLHKQHSSYKLHFQPGGDGRITDHYLLTPLTVPAGKFSGLTSAHTHACARTCMHAHIHTCNCLTEYSSNKSAFNTVHFDGNNFTCSYEKRKERERERERKRKKASTISNRALLLVVLKRQRSKRGTERVHL